MMFPDYNISLLRAVIILFLLLFIIGCSGVDPASPEMPPVAAIPQLATRATTGQMTQLLGYYTVEIDFEKETIVAIPERAVLFTANIVGLLNGNPDGLKFYQWSFHNGDGYIDIDINVQLTHPLPGHPAYNGYDVRGVFMGNGSSSLTQNPDLIYPVNGIDQFMLPDPDDGHGGPDGYTRWFNFNEFSTGGMNLFSYTPGNYAAPDFAGTATLCPYKYFADGLGKYENLSYWLDDNSAGNSVFSSGSANQRNYYLRFPDGVGATFGYAILANWSGPQNHPSNTREAVACKAWIQETLYYVDPDIKGGDLIMDLTVFDWKSQLNGGVMEDYKIYIESTVLSSVYECTPEDMTPDSSGDFTNTYYINIPADNVTGTEGNEFWVIIEYPGSDYSNPYGVPNDAADEHLTSYFRYDLPVADHVYNWILVISPDGGEQWVVGSDQEIYWISHNVSGNVMIEYSKDWFISDVNLIVADTENDGAFTWLDIPADPSDTVAVRVSSVLDPGKNDISNNAFSIVDGNGWALTWGGTYNDGARAVAVDDDGNSYVTGWLGSSSNADAFLVKVDALGEEVWAKSWGETYSDYGRAVAVHNSGRVYVIGDFRGHVDFDPGIGSDYHNSYNNNNDDVYLSRFDFYGNHLWTVTWGGASLESCKAVTVDDTGNIYVGGYFRGTVDFDPGAGISNGTSNGIEDAFVSCFDPSGGFLWNRTWGGSGADVVDGLATTSSDDVLIAGGYVSTVDFDPGAGVESHTSNGIYDCYLSKFNSSGDFVWVRNWGGSESDNAIGVDVSPSGEIYVTGHFKDSVDFNPGIVDDTQTSAGNNDHFLNKFDSSGAQQWARTWGGTGSDISREVRVYGADTVYTAGYFSGSVDFDPGPGVESHNSKGFNDISLSKFNSSGDLQWVRVSGDTINDEGWGLDVDSSGGAYITGFFFSSVDFAPPSPPCGSAPDVHDSVGMADIFLVKYSSDGCW